MLTEGAQGGRNAIKGPNQQANVTYSEQLKFRFGGFLARRWRDNRCWERRHRTPEKLLICCAVESALFGKTIRNPLSPILGQVSCQKSKAIGYIEVCEIEVFVGQAEAVEKPHGKRTP